MRFDATPVCRARHRLYATGQWPARTQALTFWAQELFTTMGYPIGAKPCSPGATDGNRDSISTVEKT